MSLPVYYNEFDKRAAAWLRELIKAALIPAGDVDERSIEDVKPRDLRGYRQCHFFAGIGGWAYALELAGWPLDRPVWTGSCPCQPFSSAGKGTGFDDQRHLWPAWFHLIRECRPPAVFGEQVASAAVGPWLDLVQADVEAVGYAFGSVAFPAAGIGAPHIRDRTYWVAYAHHISDRPQEQAAGHRQPEADRSADQHGRRGIPPMRLADLHGYGRDQGRKVRPVRAEHHDEHGCATVGLGNADRIDAGRDCRDGAGAEASSDSPGPLDGPMRDRASVAGADGGSSPVNGHWRAADWLGCRDGKWRPVEPGTFPLDHGVSARVGRLRGYGNAIVPQQAAEFILAAEESRLMQAAA